MELLKVTNVNVFPVPKLQQGGKLRAFARVVINEQLQLTSLRIYDGVNGLFVSYPNDPAHKGEDYRQLYYAITKEFRDEIESVVLKAYQDAQNIEP